MFQVVIGLLGSFTEEKDKRIRFTEDWKHAVDKKELATILSTDMSKEFDSLCHNLVIKSSSHMGSLVNH